MPQYYTPLPAFRGGSALDFSPLNEGIDAIGKSIEKNRLLAEQKRVAEALRLGQDPSQPPAVNANAPTNRLTEGLYQPQAASPSAAQSSAAAAGRDYPSTQVASPNAVTDRIIGAESGGRNNLRNPNSTATGSGQFINSTWLDTVKRSRPDIAAGKSDEQLLALRSDPNLSREMTGAYANQNAGELRSAGFEASPGNTYLAHFAGPGGARAVLSADPSTPVGSILGDQVVRANPFLARMTAGDLVSWANRKMGGASASPNAAAGRAAPASAPAAASPAAQPRAAGLNYAAGIDAALRNGDVATATKLRQMQQEEGTLGQSSELRGLQIDEAKAGAEERAVKKLGTIANTIQNAPPEAAQTMWQQVLQTHPEMANMLQAHGVDPSNVKAGTDFFIKQARGITPPNLTEVSPGASLVDKNDPTKIIMTAPRPPQNLSTAERKEVFDSDAAAQAGNSAIMTLKQAIKLNDSAYSGFGAETAGWISSQFGGTSGKSTRELENMITAQALDQLKATFGAAPTEGERKILLDIQGSVTENREVRKSIWDRALTMAQRRVDFNKTQSEAIRSGQYFKPGFSPVTPDAPEAPPSTADKPQVTLAPRPSGATDEQIITNAQKAIKDGKDPAAVKAQLEAWGIKL